MKGRPVSLRPGALPAGVRYKFASDAEVVKAADRVTRYLLAPASQSPEDGFFDPTAVVIQSGAWKRFRKSGDLGRRDALLMPGKVTLSGKDYKQEACLLRDSDEIALLGKRLQTAIAKDGGGTVRALSTEEMSKWGIFAGTDIDEPTLIIATKGGHHLFIVGFSSKGAILLDDLNFLP